MKLKALFGIRTKCELADKILEANNLRNWRKYQEAGKTYKEVYQEKREMSAQDSIEKLSLLGWYALTLLR